MGIPAISLTIILYFIIMMDHIHKKEYYQAMIWFGYTFANVGFLLAMINKAPEIH